ncbi:AAA family ATPase [Algoriphagus aestuariicola]|uniref:AAA family ATPase n=1 Tax=Algoriphagus aestuariicola TaxID=1852016 RepID=A0ABS3BTX7_9BACT|nr:adenylate/guanylate cyclase domain-containing protein [Algoriphagus aestuariicola]MBN7802336.1 AAA family ATPase [Algoriphagus aestuariicola]
MPISTYRMISKVRESSRYIVYQANRLEDSQPVTIQTFRSPYPSFRDLNHMKHEFSILSKLSHPNIIQPLSLESHENLPVLVNEGVSGVSLKIHLKKGPLPIGEFLAIAIGITQAVLYLHSKNIIHKNLNPANILIQGNGEVKVWGFEYAIERGRDLNFSNVSEALELELHYLSPEQTGRMNRPIDHRSDLYSLGAICFEMLLGRPVFQLQDPLELMHAHLAILPESPKRLRPDIPEIFDRIILKLLQKNTEDRYQSCSGLLHDLQICQQEYHSHQRITPFPLASQDHLDQFQISSKLYGREEELEKMGEVFQRTREGKAELVLVSGYSGVGKSSFVREFQKHLDSTGGFFVSGKFEQYRKNPPLSSLLLALNDLVSQVLMLSEEQQDYWRTLVMKAIGSSGQLILEIMPELERLIGPQPKIPPLPIAESKNRFDQVFNSFVRAFARKDHPLCIFLDDLQWLDTTTRRWLETTLEDPGLSHLLVICAYRENEVSPSHPMMLMKDRLKNHDLRITEIDLQPLPLTSVEQIIGDSLGISLSQSAELAEIVFRKTLGNPFFIRQCLLTLFENGAIYLSPATHHWTYHAKKALEVKISDNVVELMAELFHRLPAEVQTTLKFASCVGTVFSIEILSVLLEIPEAELEMQLKLAEKLCIIENLKSRERFGEGDFIFQHDKIQQAALGMLPDREKKQIRLAIAESISSKLGEIGHTDFIYTVTDHFNFAQSLIQNQETLKRLVRLNLAAGIRSKNANAYESFLNYIKSGMDLIEEGHLEMDGSILKDLYLYRAEAEHLTGNNQSVEEYFDKALQFSNNVLEKARVMIRKIQYYNNIRNFEAAYQACREASADLGVAIPERFSAPALLIEFAKYKVFKGRREVNQLIDLPEMRDEKLKTAILVMAAAGQSAFQIRPELCVLLCAVIVNLCLKHGNTSGAFVGYLGFGSVFHSGILGFRTTGYKFGKLILELIEKYHDYGGRAEAYFVTGYFSIPWRRPALEMEQNWQTAYEAGLEAGDQFHASCAICATLQSQFMRGVPFETVMETSKSFLDYLRRIQSEEGILTQNAVVQAINNLKGQTEDISSFTDGKFKEDEYVDKLAHFNSRHFAHFYFINKMQTLYLWEQYEKAQEIALVSETYLKDSPGMLHTAEHYFYQGLILAARIPDLTGLEKLKASRKLQGIVRKFTTYSLHCPDNFEHKYHLLEAELNKTKGRTDLAQSHYYKALEAAEQYHYLQIQALANRRLFELFLESGQKKMAAIHLNDAEYQYDLLGADGIVDLMGSKRSFGDFSPKELKFGTSMHAGDKSKRDLSTQELDLRSVMKSTQAISQEIRLKDLLRTLMKIIIENAGAQRMVFLFKNGQDLLVQSESCTKDPEPKLFNNLPLMYFTELSKEVIHFVAKTKENIILDNASKDARFSRDPYIQKEALKSILCVPLVKKGEVTGIIYLENNLIEGAFTKERLDLINILSSQMAISLENALLYQNMEDKVRLRTKQLHEEKEKADKLLLNILPPDVARELIDQGQFKARHFTNVSVMFTDIVNFSQIGEQLSAEDLVAELNYFYCEFDRIMDKYGLEKIKTIGDSYMCAGGLNQNQEFDVSNIILAAFEINEFIRKNQTEKRSSGAPDISMRIGIHSGPVIAGIVGIKKFAYDIWGDTVNIASRMETSGQAGKINISGDTYRLIEDRFRFIPRGKIEVKNKGQVEMYFVEPLK